MSFKRYTFFAVTIICAFALLVISVTLVYHYIKKPSDTIIIHNIVISDEIDKQSRLTGTISRFSYGTRQIFVFFDFEKAQIGTNIYVYWYYGGREVHSDPYTLNEPSGSIASMFLKDDGSMLPRGVYTIKVMQDDRAVIPEYVFNIF